MKLTPITLTVLTALASLNAYAHDLWINPLLDGQTINASLGYGHDFPAQGSEPDRQQLFNAPELSGAQGKHTLKASGEDYVFTSDVAKKDGNYILSAAMKSTYWSKTPDGWKQQDRLAGNNVISCQLSSKYAKNVFTIGKATSTDTGWLQQSSGHPLEIIPQTNPLTSETVTFKVLYNGQPLTNKTVTLDSAEYLKNPKKESHGDHDHVIPQYKATTDQQGIVSFKGIDKGLYMALVNNKTPYPDSQKCDTHSSIATLSFQHK